MSQSKIKALKYEVQSVGKHIKSSKKRYFWSLSIGERYYNLLLDNSLVTGKLKLSINGKVFHQIQENGVKRARYEHSFIIDGCLFNIIEDNEQFELRVNNRLFSQMLNAQMSEKYFQQHQVDDADFQLENKFKQPEYKKVVLNLPGMGNAMKKKKTTVAQSENWNDFAGSSNFPNYFGEAESKPQAVKIQKAALQQQVKSETRAPSTEQFCTLQNLFKTITQSGEYQPKSSQATPTYEISQIPAIPQINLQEFNTMQNLFSTTSPAQTISASSKQQSGTSPKEDFNTMQQMFSTLKLPKKQQQSDKVTGEAHLPRAGDFNTMQSLFSTLKQPSQPQPDQCQDFSKINLNDFNTMQNLFTTGLLPSQPSPVQKPPQQQQQIFTKIQCVPQTKITEEKQASFSKININDFNTMQNLFATNGLKDVLGNTDKANKVQQSSKKTELPNSNDFNTMQNLFATNAGKTEKNQNVFWQF